MSYDGHWESENASYSQTYDHSLSYQESCVPASMEMEYRSAAGEESQAAASLPAPAFVDNTVVNLACSQSQESIVYEEVGFTQTHQDADDVVDQVAEEMVKEYELGTHHDEVDGGRRRRPSGSAHGHAEGRPALRQRAEPSHNNSNFRTTAVPAPLKRARRYGGPLVVQSQESFQRDASQRLAGSTTDHREGGWIQREIRASGASRGKSIMNGSSPGVTIAFSSDEDEEAGPNVFVPSRERQIVGEKRDNKPKVSAPPAVRHVSAAIKTSAENRDCRSGDDYGSEEEQEKYYEYQRPSKPKRRSPKRSVRTDAVEERPRNRKRTKAASSPDRGPPSPDPTMARVKRKRRKYKLSLGKDRRKQSAITKWMVFDKKKRRPVSKRQGGNA
jgi:hypothetical protein